MRVLIGYSACNLTRRAFELRGHEVWTNDLLPARDGHQNHLQTDFWEIANDRWDMAVLHPMCTYLTCSAAWAYGDGPYHQKVKPETLVGAARREAREEALENFRRLLKLSYPKAIENPAVSFVNKAIRPPDQKVHPFEFGDDASKVTGFWYDRVPPLKVHSYMRFQGRVVSWEGKSVERWSNQTDSGQEKTPPSDNRWLERSKTFPGIAAAMGRDWG